MLCGVVERSFVFSPSYSWSVKGVCFNEVLITWYFVTLLEFMMFYGGSFSSDVKRVWCYGVLMIYILCDFVHIVGLLGFYYSQL